jgi:hypothetical protein
MPSSKVRTAAAASLLFLPGLLAPPARAEVTVNIDVKAAPDLGLWADRARRICEIWYPVITDLLASSRPEAAVQITVEPRLSVPAYAVGGRPEIHVSAAFVRSQQARGEDDFGMLIHELTHTLQRYPRSERWLTEGIADYIRYERYEPTVPRRVFDIDQARYDQGYWVSSGFLAWIEQTHDRALVRKLHAALGAGGYKESVFWRETTGRDLSTLWKDFVAVSRVRQSAARPVAGPASSGPDLENPPLGGALAAARSLKKPLVLNLSSAWCDRCRELDATLSRPAVAAAVGAVHLVRYDIQDEPGRGLAARLRVTALPTLVALDADGRELDRHPGRDPLVWLAEVPLLGADGLEASVAGAEEHPENAAWQLVAARRLLKADREPQARSFLDRAAAANNPLVAAQALALLTALDLEAADSRGARAHAERLLDQHPTSPEARGAFRLLAVAVDPPRALLARALDQRLQAVEPTADELSDLLLHAARAGDGEAAARAAARLAPAAMQDPQRYWLLAEAAHLQGASTRALNLIERARAFAPSGMRSLMDEDLARYRRKDRRPGRLVSALGATVEEPRGWPVPWSAALARLRARGPTDPELDRGLVGRWRFDERPPAPARDASGLGQTGTLVGFAAGDRRPGRRGGALAYDPARRTVVTVNDSDELSPRQELTVAAWIRAVDWDGNRRILQKGSADDQYRLTAEGGKLVFHVQEENGEGGPRSLMATAGLPPENSWVHVAGTYDGTRLRLLVNGVEVASTAAGGGRLAVTRDPLVIGGKRPADPSAGNGFHGLIDEVLIYDRALQDRELRQLAKGAPGSPPNPSRAQRGHSTVSGSG